MMSPLASKRWCEIKYLSREGYAVWRSPLCMFLASVCVRLLLATCGACCEAWAAVGASHCCWCACLLGLVSDCCGHCWHFCAAVRSWHALLVLAGVASRHGVMTRAASWHVSRALRQGRGGEDGAESREWLAYRCSHTRKSICAERAFLLACGRNMWV